MRRTLLLFAVLAATLPVLAQNTEWMHIKFLNGDSVTYKVSDIAEVYFTVTEGDAPMDTTVNDVEVTVTKNIRYRVGESEAWKLNIAVPTKVSATRKPAIIIIHGDKFYDGSKDDNIYNSLMLDYASQGYVALSIDYRLFREERIPACIEDVKCAVRWLRANAAKYNVNTSKIGAYGHSAGGAMALMLALSTDNKELEGDGPYEEYSSAVACAAASAPRVEWGTSVATYAKTEWWPVGYIKASTPPLLLLQGANDDVSKPTWTDNFVTKMREAGNKKVEYYKLSTAHNIAVKTEIALSRTAMDEFFNRNLGLNNGKMHIDKIKVIDNGGSGKYQAMAVTDRTFSKYTIYRPVDLDKAVEKEGPLPVLIFGNGACSDSSLGYERMLNYFASNGYIVIAIGEMKMAESDREDGGSEASQMADAINWITKQNTTKNSVYYQKIATDRMATSGHSCGGAQAIYNAANTHLKTYIIFNAGMGSMSMAGADKTYLNKLRGPILYLTGGNDDVAYGNACGDYDYITKTPVVHMYDPSVGHGGTYWEANGGGYGKLALLWLDWHLKDKTTNSKYFLTDKSTAYPACVVKYKNFPEE